MSSEPVQSPSSPALAVVEDGVVTERQPAAVQPLRPAVTLEDAVEAVEGAQAPPTRPRFARVGRLVVAAADALSVTVAMAASYLLLPPMSAEAEAGGAFAYQRVGLVALPLWILVFRHYRLYNARHVTGRRDELGRVVHAVGVSSLLTAVVAYFLDLPVERSWFLMLFGVALVTVSLERELIRYGFALLRRRGRCLRPVAIAGTGREAVTLAQAFSERPELGYCVVGVISNGHGEVDPELGGRYPVLDAKTKIVDELRAAGAAGVVVATTDVDLETSNRLIRTLTDAAIHVELSSSLRDIDATRLSVRPLGDFSVLYVEPVKRDGWLPVAKRVFDVSLSVLGLVLVLPVLALAAVAIKLTSPGPVFYRQERVGYRGRRFRILKLRSMYVNNEQMLKDLVDQLPEGPVIKLRRDPRVTPVGRVLRRFSIDELPQLINVVRGDMSLVGPRPEQPSEVALWTPELFDRLRVRPGVTGVWQVNGRSAARDSKDRWDLYYVDNWSIWHDLAILFKTVPVVFASKGAF